MTDETLCIQSNNFTERFPIPFGLIVHSAFPPNNIQSKKLNNYMKLLPHFDISVSLGFSKYTREKVGLLHSVDIRLLDGTLQVPVTLSNSTIEFSGYITIFNDNIYRSYLSASGSTGSTWEDLTLRVDGWFSKYDNGFVRMIEKCVRDKLRAIGEEANNRKVKADAKLAKAETDLVMAQRQLNNAHESYTNVSQRLELTKKTLEKARMDLAVAEKVVANATGELRKAEDAINNVCQLSECEPICQNATRKRTVYEDVYSEAIGTCNSQCNVTARIRVEPFTAPTYVWRFLYSCWKYDGNCDDLPCQIEICSFVCKRVNATKPVFNYGTIVVERPCLIPCTVQRYNRTIERTEDYIDSCGRMIPDPVCVDMNQKCTVNRELALRLIERKGSELVRPLRERNEAREAVNVAKIRVDEMEAERNIFDDQVNSSETFYTLTKQFKNITEQNHQKIIGSIKDDLELYNVIQQYNGSQIFNITNATFSVFVSNTNNPKTFPINLNIHYRNKQETFSITYRFSDSFSTQKDSIVQSIVNHFLNKPLSRQRRQEEADNDNFGQSQFEMHCTRLKSITNFLQYLQTSLQTSIAETVQFQQSIIDLIQHLETNSTATSPSFTGNFTGLQLFNITHNITDLGRGTEPLNVSNSVLSFIEDTYTDLQSRAESVLLNINRTALFQWRTEVDLLLQTDGTIADRQCLGLLDCVVVFNGSLESLLAFGPSTASDSLLMSLPLASELLIELATNENLAINEAIDKLEPVLMIVNGMNNNGYWCSTSPEILIHPIVETSVEINGRLMLTCEGNSSLPVTYQWRKDGVVIPNANNNTLIINNMQISDEGNYSCEVTNDVKFVLSTNSSVHVFILPEFYQLPVSVVTYIGDSNGAYFTCNSTSRPDPGWRWYHRASEHEEWREIIGEETNELLVRNPDKSNEGQYICQTYNDYGNITSDPVSLRVVSVTARVLSYTVELSMNLINSTSNATMHDVFETNLIDQFKEGVDIGNVTISGISSSTSGSILLVSFELISTNVTVQDTGRAPLQDIALNLLASKQELNRVRDNLREFVESEGLELKYNGQDYEYTQGTFTVQIPEIQCPPGQQLHSNRFLCGKC